MARNKVCLVALIAMLVSGPVLAQPTAGTTGQTRRSPNNPQDFGPFTPEANRAFQGGGMILQGAPGEQLRDPSLHLQDKRRATWSRRADGPADRGRPGRQTGAAD